MSEGALGEVFGEAGGREGRDRGEEGWEVNPGGGGVVEVIEFGGV